MLRWLSALNESIAIKATTLIGTMSCVYLFTLWSILPIAFGGSRDVVFYVSGGILQLVLLPLIMVGSSLLSRVTEERAKEDHTALMTEVGEIREILDDVREEVVLLKQIHDAVVNR